jgi:hypothetical protein
VLQGNAGDWLGCPLHSVQPAIKLRVVQFRGFSRMTLSSLQAHRAILSGFSPSNCTEKSKQKTGLPDLPVKGPAKVAK